MSELQNLTKKERRRLKKLKKEENTRVGQRKKKINSIIIYGIIFVFVGLAVSGIIYLVAKKSSANNPISLPASLILLEDDWLKGNKEAELTLIEYSDFQCPACAYFHPIVEKLAGDYKDNLKIVYRHFPLPQHKNAVLAGQAAEAAGKQGKFWEMAGKIFESQAQWSEVKNEEAKNIFKELARTLDLNIEQWEKDIENEEIKKSIDEDYKEGVKIGINATPTFFLNGQKLQNPRSYEEFKEILNKEKISD